MWRELWTNISEQLDNIPGLYTSAMYGQGGISQRVFKPDIFRYCLKYEPVRCCVWERNIIDVTDVEDKDHHQGDHAIIIIHIKPSTNCGIKFLYCKLL